MNIGVTAGPRSTTDLSNEKRLMRDVEAKLQELEPSAGPLTTILMRLETVTAVETQIEWMEDQLLPDFDQLTGAMLVGDVVMTVANYAYYRNGDLVKINDYETVLVATTPNSTTVTITRAFGTIPAAAAPAAGNEKAVEKLIQFKNRPPGKAISVFCDFNLL